MTGLPNFNYPAFEEAARMLQAQGYAVRSPHTNPVEGRPWSYAMRLGLRMLLNECNAVVLLPGWRKSRGASIEAELAASIDYPLFELIEGQPRPLW